jgi:undecaprenyl pyrophosphate synthase
MRPREEFVRIYERLHNLAHQNMMCSPGYATEILQKFAFWSDLHEVHLVIRASPEARQAIDISELWITSLTCFFLFRAFLLFSN